MTDDDKSDYLVRSYDPSQDKWTTLPQLPAKFFGLGQIKGKLVVVGGLSRLQRQETNEVYMLLDESSKKWNRMIPSMPTARWHPSILSLPSVLIVAGGYNLSTNATYRNTVEIFKSDTSQWYRTDPLPTACLGMSLVTTGNTCYALGGYFEGSHLNQALHASIDDLLHNAVPASQIARRGSNDSQSAWKALPNTPSYRPAAAILVGNLLAIGGRETSCGGAAKKEVYMYSPSTDSWIYISDLPAPRSHTTATVLSSIEVLVIGGRGAYTCRENTVYRGTLTCTMGTYY